MQMTDMNNVYLRTHTYIADTGDGDGAHGGLTGRVCRRHDPGASGHTLYNTQSGVVATTGLPLSVADDTVVSGAVYVSSSSSSPLRTNTDPRGQQDKTGLVASTTVMPPEEHVGKFSLASLMFTVTAFVPTSTNVKSFFG
jgi:hypothetical protein